MTTRPYLKLITLLVALIVLSCVTAPARLPQTEQYPAEPGDALFQEAEGYFQQMAWEKALSSYAGYSAQFPAGRHADNALRRIGFIYREKHEFDAALGYYDRLLNEFAQSRFVDEARLAKIDLLLIKQSVPEALAFASTVLAGELDVEIRRQLQSKISELYHTVGQNTNAARLEFQLYSSAQGTQRKQWADKLKDTITQLNSEDVEAVWDEMDDHEIRGDLMYRYAVLQAILENFDDALETLTAFQKVYPQHPFIDQAATLQNTIAQRLIFTPYTIGCLLPLSGPYKLYGTRALQGIELALGQRLGGEASLPIKLIIKDTASDDKQAIQAVREMAGAKVSAIMGPIITASAAAVEAQRQHIPMIAFTQKQDVTTKGDYIFRHFITPQNQVQTLVDYFVNNVGLHEFAILYPNEAYGEAFMSLFWDESALQGARIVGAESYEADKTDFADPIKKLIGTYYSIPQDLQARPVVQVEEDPYYQGFKSFTDQLEDLLPDPVRRLTGLYFQTPDQDRVRGPAVGRIRQEEEDKPIIDFDVLFIPDAPKKAGLIIPQLVYHDIGNVYLAGTNLWHSKQLIEMTKDYVQNAILVDGFFKDSKSEKVQQFVNAFQKIYNSDPGIIEAFAFDTATFMFDLLAQPQIRLRNTLRDALQQLYYADGVTGFTAFAENGEAIKRLSLIRIKGGQFFEIQYP